MNPVMILAKHANIILNRTKINYFFKCLALEKFPVNQNVEFLANFHERIPCLWYTILEDSLILLQISH